MKISVVINTYNAEKHLERVLNSVISFDEIIICDMYSTDKTVDIAKEKGCLVYYHKKCKIVEPARNFAISKANFNWVLVIDADEIIPADLRNYLYNIIKKKKGLGGVKIPFKNYFMGQFMRSAYPDYHLRFFKKENAFWPAEIHSKVRVEGEIVTIPKKHKNLACIHIANDTVTNILNKNNKYSTQEIIRRKEKKVLLFHIISSPIFWFIKYYFIKGGFLDGTKGFIFAILKSSYKFNTLAKIYEEKNYKSV